MSKKSTDTSLSLRVATVQLDTHRAFEDASMQHLCEPLTTPILAPLLHKLTPDSPVIDDLRLLRQGVADAYGMGLLPRLVAIVRFCAEFRTDLVVFSEYSIPGSLLPQLQELATETGCTIVAGTHLVTSHLLSEPSYQSCFKSPPQVNRAIAPVIRPNGPTVFQEKLWQSHWESQLECGDVPERFTIRTREAREATFGVAICIDFIRHRDKRAAAIHEKWRKNSHILVVPACSPNWTSPVFAASAQDIYLHFQLPVAFANAAEYGGTCIFGFGQPKIKEPLAAGSVVPPLDTREGICIVKMNLHQRAESKPRTLDQGSPVEPIVYGLLLREEDEPLLAQAARALRNAPDPASFRRICREHRVILAQASRQFAGIELVQKRWDRLAKEAVGENNLAKLRGLAADLWLPRDVLSPTGIERQLALGVSQVLAGLAEREGLLSADRSAFQSARNELGRICEQRGWKLSPSDDASLMTHVVSVLQSQPTRPRRGVVRTNGTVDCWDRDAGSPPSRLLNMGFALSPACELTSGNSDLDSLRGYARELELAATWSTLRHAAPAWVGWSPDKLPVLVFASGHVIALTTFVPDAENLRLVRRLNCLPLPVAFILGDHTDFGVRLESGVLSLAQAIQQLAVQESHLRELTKFPYSEHGARFVPPTCRSGSGDNAVPLQALDALTEWFSSSDPRCVVVGGLGDGRSSLIRMWCAQVALVTLHGRELPIYYADCTAWKRYGQFAEQLGELSLEGRAALRLAVSTGNCLLVIDGLDDIVPDDVPHLPFFDGWITPRTRLLQTSCWAAQEATVLWLLPAGPDERARLVKQPWPLLERLPHVPPRCILAGAKCMEDLENPDGARMEAYLTRLAAAVVGLMEGPDLEQVGSPLDVLEDLAHALWTARPVCEGESVARLHDSEFRRFRASRRSGGAEPDPYVALVAAMYQSPIVVAEGAAAPPFGHIQAWLGRETALRGPGFVVREGRPRERSVRWLGFVWDAVALHVLARRIVGALAQRDDTVLEILPLSPAVRQRCRALPEWSTAREHLARVLVRPGKSQFVAANALLLATGDDVLASSEAEPWHLEGADLRCLTLDGARLDHARLSGAVLRGASLRGASLRMTTLRHADLTRCDLTGVDLSGCDTQGAHFTGATLDGVSLREARLDGTELDRSYAMKAAPELANARLDGVSLRAAEWISIPAVALSSVDPLACAWMADVAHWRDVKQLEAVVPSPIAYGGALAWSSDGHWIATGDHRGQLHLWSTGPVRCVGLRNAHSATLRAAAFSPDSLVLATAGDDHKVQLWNLVGLTLRRTLEHHAPVTGVFWESADILWTVADTPRRWDITSGSVLDEFPGLAGVAYEGALVAAGRLLVLACRPASPFPYRGNELLVLDRNTMQVLAQHQFARASVSAVDPAGKRVFVPTQGLAVYLLERSGEGPLARWDFRYLERSPTTPYPLETWSHDGKFFALGSGHLRSGQALVHCFDVEEQAPLRLVESAHELAWGIQFSPVDRRLALIGDKGLRILDLATGQVDAASAIEPLAGHLEHLIWTRGGLRAHGPRLIVDVELESGVVNTKSMGWPRQTPNSMPPTGDRSGDIFVFADDDIFSIWDEPHRRRTMLQARPTTRTKATHGGSPLACFSPDGRRVMIQQAFAESRTRFDIWDTATGVHRYSELLPGFGSVILVESGVPCPLIEKLMGETLHFIDFERNARLTIHVGDHSRVHASANVRELVLLRPPQRLCCLHMEPFLKALADLPPGGRAERPLELSDYRWTTETAVNAHGCAFHEGRGFLAVPAPLQVEIRQLSDGAPVLTLPTRTGIGTPAFSPGGKHLAYLWGSELQLWNIERSELAARFCFLSDGIVALAGQSFQRLVSGSDSARSSLGGFYGQVGAELWPLERLEALESTDLCAALWADVCRRP